MFEGVRGRILDAAGSIIDYGEHHYTAKDHFGEHGAFSIFTFPYKSFGTPEIQYKDPESTTVSDCMFTGGGRIVIGKNCTLRHSCIHVAKDSTLVLGDGSYFLESSLLLTRDLEIHEFARIFWSAIVITDSTEKAVIGARFHAIASHVLINSEYGLKKEIDDPSCVYVGRSESSDAKSLKKPDHRLTIGDDVTLYTYMVSLHASTITIGSNVLFAPNGSPHNGGCSCSERLKRTLESRTGIRELILYDACETIGCSSSITLVTNPQQFFVVLPSARCRALEKSFDYKFPALGPAIGDYLRAGRHISLLIRFDEFKRTLFKLGNDVFVSGVTVMFGTANGSTFSIGNGTEYLTYGTPVARSTRQRLFFTHALEAVPVFCTKRVAIGDNCLVHILHIYKECILDSLTVGHNAQVSICVVNNSKISYMRESAYSSIHAQQNKRSVLIL